ncbi:MAG: TIGR04282 family arsenosugar biosynthesis glycosyltransferase [Candidatus Brocadia sp.]|nr:TIGR04282 family arsenosugar biosynthesis glycosyltransferase [Candidatus Brocadia sp.]
MENALIVFLKYPAPGQVKTRLAKDIGDEKACAIYKSLAEGVIKNVFSNNSRTYKVHIFFTPADKKSEIKSWLQMLLGSNQDTGMHYLIQEGNTLGERMSHAFKQTLQVKDCKRCIIIGTDCPGIDAALLEKAFESLKKRDVVIGHCKDGGYYLLGMSVFVPDLFEDIAWSTNMVFNQTVEKIRKNNLSFDNLSTLADIDTQEDLYLYESVLI